MGSSLSISVPGLKPEEATNCLVASAMDKGYEVQKVHSDDLKFRIQPIADTDPRPTSEVLIIKGHGVFNIKHTERRVGPLPVAEVEKIKEETEMEDVDLTDKVKEEVEDSRPIVYFASIERYCAESDVAHV